MIAPLQRRLTMAMEKPAEPTPRRIADTQGPSADDLDRMTRGMPSGTVETFAQFIQPISMNHCASCHGSSSDAKLPLIRVYAGQPTIRRTTQRNLHAALQWVDRENPGASRLLTAASGPHGTAKAPVFTDREVVQYRRLVDWVYHVAQCPSPVAVEMLVGPDPWAEVCATADRADPCDSRPAPSSQYARKFDRPGANDRRDQQDDALANRGSHHPAGDPPQ